MSKSYLKNKGPRGFWRGGVRNVFDGQFNWFALIHDSSFRRRDCSRPSAGGQGRSVFYDTDSAFWRASRSTGQHFFAAAVGS